MSLVHRGVLELPKDTTDPTVFFVSQGKAATRRDSNPLTLVELLDKYQNT